MTTLRPYQVKTIELIDAAFARGRKAPLAVAPTGSGKTIIAAAIMRREVSRGRRCLFLAPRRELVTQTSRKLGDEPHGILLAGLEARQDLFAPIQVASVDTLRSRLIRRNRIILPEPALVIVDEAHLSITKARQALLELWPNALRIGFTATPTRKDGRALGTLYDELVEPTTVADLMRDGFLVGARYFSVSEPDLARVRTVAGDYNQGELELAMNQPRLIGDIVATWLARAANRRTVVFASSIAHSVALCEEFLRAGAAAEHVDADTPQELRDATFERFRNGETQILCNCFLASYGFDLPELSAVVLARPTKSLQLYLQMLGRGLRTAEGKRDCLVLDHSGAVHSHGFAHEERRWTLEGERALVDREKRPCERRAVKQLTCPECKCVFAGARLCPECKYFFPPAGKEVTTLDGELVEIGEHLAPEQRDQLAFYAELRGFAVEKRYRNGWCAHKFREKFGSWPPRTFEDAIAAQPSIETRRWIRSRTIAWLKSRAHTPEEATV